MIFYDILCILFISCYIPHKPKRYGSEYEIVVDIQLEIM